jgi:hypothetical protein
MGYAWTSIAKVAASAMEGYSQIQAARAEAAWHDYNAKIANRNAEQAVIQSKAEAKRRRQEIRKLLGVQGALYGKAGVTFEGSPLLVMADTAAEGELDARLIEYEGLLKKQAYKMQARASKLHAKGIRTASYWQAGSSLLGGAASGTSMWASQDGGGG